MDNVRSLLKKLKNHNIDIHLSGDNLKINYDSEELDAVLFDEIKNNKNLIINFLRQIDSPKKNGISIDPVEKSASYELSSSQKRLWVLSQFEDGGVAYNMHGFYEFEGEVNIDLLNLSFISLIQRHEILRTVFKTDETGSVKQFILPANELAFEIKINDFQNIENQSERISDELEKEIRLPFDLRTGPLLKVKLLKLNPDKFGLIYVMHHIISDGWSMHVLIKNLFAIYKSYIDGDRNPLIPLTIQYKDYAAWQQKQLNSEAFNIHKSYWLDVFSGELPTLLMPLDKSRPLVKTFNGGNVNININKNIYDKIRSISQQHNATPFMYLLSCVYTLLYKYSGQTDIIIGSVIAGREHVDLEEQIGVYINTLALRCNFDPKKTFSELFHLVKKITLNSYEHQIYPFDELVFSLDLKRDMSRNPLFDVMISLENTNVFNSSKDLYIGSSDEKTYNDSENSISKFDLTFIFSETLEGLYLNLEYNTDLFHKSTIERLAKHFDQLLSNTFLSPDKNLKDISFLSSKDCDELLLKFNDTELYYPKNKTIIDLFEDQVAKTPDSIAIKFEEKKLTYKELNEQSNQLANYLRKQYAIRPDDLIGIELDRGLEMIVSMLSILKSGGAYVPIDLEYPQERIDYIINDSNCKVVIDGKKYEEFSSNKKKYSKNNLPKVNVSSNLAYIIYTSGSTGKPKGVMIEHGNLSSFIHWSIQEFRESNFETVLGVTSICFDLSVFEILYTLSIGKVLRLLKNALSIPLYVDDSEAILLNTVPSVVKSLQNSMFNFSNIKVLNMAGEPIPEKIIESLNLDVIEVRNLYGPSEDTTYSTTYKILNDKRVLIGCPICNTQIYILNEDQHLCPLGVIGELYIGGDGLARGYLNQPELTAEKFISSPFNSKERLYKTGDLGRWLADGNIEFIGRKDDQVKIRGYRIELGEIEHALLKNVEIEAAIVVAKENQNAEKELVAYIVSKSVQNTRELRSYLKEILPDYMLPTYYVQLESLPLTSNGKVDKKSLPAPEGLGLLSGIEYIAPRTDIEKKLVKIWEEVLQREKIGIKDDFFALGGHSLKAVRLSNEYEKGLSVKIFLKDLFAHTSIESHAKLIQSSKKSEFIQIEKVARQASYPISDAQRRLWVLSQFEGGSIAYNIPNSIPLNQDIDIGCFKRAIDSTIERHEILRTVFKEDEAGEIRQWILDKEDLGFKIDYKDFREEKTKVEKVKDYITEDSYKAFDLEKGPLLRASLLRVEDEAYVFYFNMHHIISDGWSMEVLSKDVLAYYEAYTNNKNLELKDLRIQYKDYSAWQLAQLGDESFKTHKAYWLLNLSGKLPLLDLPATKQRPILKTNNGRSLSAYIDNATTGKLKRYSESMGGSLFMGLLSVWNILMYRYTSQTDIITGIPIAGREHADLEDQIGFYVNTLALRNELNPEDSFDELFVRVKQNTLNAYSHQMYPFDRLVEELNLQRDTSRNAVFDVMLVLQNNSENRQELELNTEELNQISDLGYSTSKFDLEIGFNEIGNYLSLNIEYNSDVYDIEIIENLINHYKKLLYALLESPKEKISQIDYLSEEEKHRLLVTFNDTKAEYPRDKTIVDLFEEQVAKTPNNVAVVFEDKQLTYRELNERSNQLGHYLRQTYKISPDDLIGIMLDRSEWIIISILGVLKSGAAYVPIDPEYPQERIDYMLSDSKCKAIVDRKELENFKKAGKSQKKTNLKSINTPKDLAYVIYTSGTTGQSKGVMIEHNNIIRLLKTYAPLFDFNSRDVWTMFHSYAFDFSVWEMYGALFFGSKLVLVSKIIAQDTVSYFELLEREGVTILNQTPSAFYNLSKEKKSNRQLLVRYVIFGGEALNPGKLQDWRDRYPSCQLINMYGITETTVHTTYKEINQEDVILNRSNIGKAIPTVNCMILDSKNQLLPLGVIGELYIGGDGLARGYLNQPELTAEKFISSPFNSKERLYKTGDLGRWLADGNIEFIGRKDDQVKIRGYRIELGEIEHALLKNVEIEAAIVVAKENQNAEKELVAYIVSKSVQNTRELRSYLKEILPDYMLPTYYVQLESLPLTSNGKVDKKSLPAPEGLGLLSGIEYIAPRTDIEKKLVKIWEEVLQREKIGIKDDFFALGGHSLKAVRLSNEYKLIFNKKMALNFFISNPTIQEHAECIIGLSSTITENQTELINLNTFSINNKNIIMIPPMQGESIYFTGFSKFIENKYNCYGINYGIDHNFKSVVELSQYYAKIINKYSFNRTNILYVLGFSMGASIAFEIVKILEGLNYKCELILIDGIPNTRSFFNAMRRSNSTYKEKEIDKYVTLASGFSTKESLILLRNRISSNPEMLNNYMATGMINSNILCLEQIGREQKHSMKLWSKFTDGQFRLDNIASSHDEIFDKINYQKLYDFIQKNTS